MIPINNKSCEMLDVIGIGIGPFNLSVAALLSPLKKIKSGFFEQNAEFAWHPGMLLPDSEIQVSYLKDLVTLADPTSPYSFIAFLAKHKRLYRFINARFPRVLRHEFNQYLRWVSQTLSNLHFKEKIEQINYSITDKYFSVQTSRRVINSKHLILGNGPTPHVPACVKPYLSNKIFHNKDFLLKKHYCKNKRVVIIGGGQSGAEIFDALITDSRLLPTQLTWITRRQQFHPIDDSIFANELFTPAHSRAFYELAAERKKDLLSQHVLASDGISIHLLENIYRKLYTLEFLNDHGRFYELLPHHALITCEQQQSQILLTLFNNETSSYRMLSTDVVILCTGYQQVLPTYIESFKNYLVLNEGKYQLNQDFSLIWNGLAENKIYVQNAARHSHGVADPNLSLMAWRSATIINSITEETVYDVDNNNDTIVWSNLYKPHRKTPLNDNTMIANAMN